MTDHSDVALTWELSNPFDKSYDLFKILLGRAFAAAWMARRFRLNKMMAVHSQTTAGARTKAKMIARTIYAC